MGVCLLKHENEMDTVWGRPGAGAPNNMSNKLANMNAVLHAPRTEVGGAQREY